MASEYFHFQPTEEQVIYAATRCAKVISDCAAAGVKQHKVTDRRFIGLIGEVCVQDLLCLPRSEFSALDGGVDLVYNGLRVDVKVQSSVSVPHAFWEWDVPCDVLSNDVDAFLLLQYVESVHTFFVIGWVTKEEFLEFSTFRASGSFKDGSNIMYYGDMYSLPYGRLWSVTSLDELRDLGVVHL